MTEQYFIGVDVAKAFLDVYIHPDATHKRYPNTAPGRRALLAAIEHLPAGALVIFEASGGYERALQQTLAQAGLKHACVQPARVKAFLNAGGHHAKTDRLDAKALALFGQAGMARTSAARDETPLALRDMMRGLETIRKQKAVFDAQLEKLDPQSPALASLQALAGACEKEDRAMLDKIRQFVEQHPELQSLIDQLMTMPGIGFYTACIIAGELPEIGQCSKTEIAALTGTAPFTRQSGQWSGRATIKGGRGRARKALYMAALSASRYEPTMKAFYQKLKNKGKPFKVAITALMRKIIITLNAMVKNNQNWSCNCA